MKKHFGARVRAAREAKGYTQRALGALMRMDSNSIARVERGEQGMRWAAIEKLVDVLGEPASFFFSNEKPSSRPKPSPEEAVDLMAEALENEAFRITVANALKDFLTYGK